MHTKHDDGAYKKCVYSNIYFYIQISVYFFPLLCFHTVPPMTIDEELVAYIENHTKGQRNNREWLELHKGRITSSIFGDVLHSRDKPLSLVKNIIEGSGLNRYQTVQ